MSDMHIYVFDDLDSAKAFELPDGYEAACGTPKVVSGDLVYNATSCEWCTNSASDVCSNVAILIAEAI